MDERFVRVMFDTNIYGFIAKENEPGKLLECIASSNIMVCGSRVVSKELRDIPLRKTQDARKLRNDVLRFYRFLVKEKRDYEINKLITDLAGEYMRAFRLTKKDEAVQNDFLIVATASIHHVKIVCSEDEKTMKSLRALKTYEKVNQKFQLPKPEFISFADFKKIIKYLP